MSDLLERWGAYLLIALCLALSASCAKSKGPETGTNTNWLQQCDVTADCAGDGDCLCNVCTRSCTNEAACSGLGQPAACVAPANGCGGTSGPGSVCLPAPAGSNGRDGGPTSSGDAGAGNSDAGLTLTRMGATVQIGDRYRPCDLDDDCVLVSTGCNGCCQQDAIRARDRAAYEQNFNDVCSDYRGSVCDCQPLDLVPRCQEGRCAAVERSTDACTKPIDCKELDCIYAPYTLACDGGVHVHEGLCGDVRYRNAVAMAGSTWYWNATSGALLAVVIGNDVTGACAEGITYGDPSVVARCPLVIDATTAICE